MILLNIFKIIWWMNIIVGIMDQCDTYIDLTKYMSVTYIVWSSNFASYLEDYLMEKRCIWDNGSVWLKDRPSKIYVGQWPIFRGPLILPCIIVRLKLFLYIKKWHRPGVFVPLRALALVFTAIFSLALIQVGQLSVTGKLYVHLVPVNPLGGFWGARWLSGRVSDSGARGPGFETYRRRVVSLSKTLYSPKVLVNYPGSDGSVPTWLKNCWLGR